MTAMIHETIQVHMLPWNMVTMQAEHIIRNYADALFPVLSACEKHICVRCTHGTNTRLVQRVSKLRMDTTTMQITCATCKTDDTVVRVNVFGKLNYIRNVKYFGCHECTALHIYDPVNPLACTRYDIQAQIPRVSLGDVVGSVLIPANPQRDDNKVKRTDRKNRCKWCGRVCSARTLQLLHVPSASIVHITLCFKHFPAAFMISMILDVDTCVRYIVDINKTASQTSGRSKAKILKLLTSKN